MRIARCEIGCGSCGVSACNALGVCARSRRPRGCSEAHVSLTYDTPAGKLVYDDDPDTAYDADGRRFGHKALRVRDGRIETFDPHPAKNPDKVSGFGNVTARRLLSAGPPAKHPWLTPELATIEIAIGEYRSDRAQVALDSVT